MCYLCAMEIFSNISLHRVQEGEVDIAMQFIEQARARLKSLGINQWQDGYPCISNIVEDMENAKAYFLTSDGRPAGYLCIDFDGEPAYEQIQWKLKAPYVVVHRMAIGDEFRGMGLATAAFRLVEELAKDKDVRCFRIDTHAGNKTMQHLLAKNDFYYCGIVHYDSGERLAFEKEIPSTYSNCLDE